MARLTNLSITEVNKARIPLAREFAHEFNVYVVLKGKGTVIATPDKEVYINTTGNPGMASGGMGDVLSGIIGSFLAQKYSLIEATKAGVYVHGLAADKAAISIGGERGLRASDVLKFLREVVN